MLHLVIAVHGRTMTHVYCSLWFLLLTDEHFDKLMILHIFVTVNGRAFALPTLSTAAHFEQLTFSSLVLAMNRRALGSTYDFAFVIAVNEAMIHKLMLVRVLVTVSS